MIPVEILGMFTKPFALTVRLFANMLAGHMVITALLLLIPLMAAVSTAFGVMIIPISLGLALSGLALVFLLLTPYDLGWHLGTSFWRLLYQLWPATVLLLTLVAAPPDP
jgi:hypothetical protein